MTDDANYDRRSMLKASGATLALGSLAGCIGGVSGGIGGSSGETTANDSPRSGETVVEVGPGGSLTFEPAELEVRPGTTVRWVWKSDTHNVVPESQPDGANWQGTDGGDSRVYDDGHEYSHTFETLGTYEYSCTPHEAAGMTGEVVVSGAASATTDAAETETAEAETTEEVTETTEEPATADDLPIEVGPGGRLQFEPGTERPVVVDPGTEVRFVWKSDAHNVVVDSQPAGADWEGTPGPATATYDEGYEYSHTFEVPGTYEFHCQPHKAAGAVGTIIVRGETATGDSTQTETRTTTDFATADDLPVEVGADDEYRFEPGTERPLNVPVGTEVRFVWRSDTHNIVVDSHPQGADWEGTPGGAGATYDEGYEHRHTFEVPGTYEFHCAPHETIGETGTIVVTEN